jgi:hypothetical protein
MAKDFNPEIGKNTRWRKGQRSPNPGGRPKYGVVSAYLRQALEGGDGDKIARALLKQAKNGNMRAISEVIDRTEGKATQTMEVAVEGIKPISPDLRNMSRDELVELIIDTGIRLIRDGLEGLNGELLDGEVLQLRNAVPSLRELHQGLRSLIEKLDKGGIPGALESNETVENKDNTKAEESGFRTVQLTEGGTRMHVYVGH